jgi:capsular polysaccharide biosynthesis protein
MRFPKAGAPAGDLPPIREGLAGLGDRLAWPPTPRFRQIRAWPAEPREVRFSPFLTSKGAPRWHFLHYRIAEGRAFVQGEGRNVLWSRHARAIAAPAAGRCAGGLIEEFNVGGGPGVPESLFAMDYQVDAESCRIADAAVRRIGGLTVPFSHFGGATFGHAVLDGLLQVWLWRDALGSGEARLGLWETPAWLAPVLDRCGVRRRAELPGDVVLLRRAGLSSALAAHGVYFPASYSLEFFDWLRGVYCLEETPVGPRRIYIRRSGLYARPVLNEAELELLAISHGFTPVTPETLSFEEQMRLFAGAETVLSPWGSGLTLAPLLHGARRVLELVPSSVTDVWFVRQAMLHGFDYTPILQASDPDGAFEANLTRIDKVLRHALRGEAAA